MRSSPTPVPHALPHLNPPPPRTHHPRAQRGRTRLVFHSPADHRALPSPPQRVSAVLPRVRPRQIGFAAPIEVPPRHGVRNRAGGIVHRHLKGAVTIAQNTLTPRAF